MNKKNGAKVLVGKMNTNNGAYRRNEKGANQHLLTISFFLSLKDYWIV